MPFYCNSFSNSSNMILKETIFDFTQLPSQPRIEESAFTILADPKRKKFGRWLFNWIIIIPYAERSRSV